MLINLGIWLTWMPNLCPRKLVLGSFAILELLHRTCILAAYSISLPIPEPILSLITSHLLRLRGNAGPSSPSFMCSKRLACGESHASRIQEKIMFSRSTHVERHSYQKLLAFSGVWANPVIA